MTPNCETSKLTPLTIDTPEFVSKLGCTLNYKKNFKKKSREKSKKIQTRWCSRDKSN